MGSRTATNSALMKSKSKSHRKDLKESIRNRVADRIAKNQTERDQDELKDEVNRLNEKVLENIAAGRSEEAMLHAKNAVRADQMYMNNVRQAGNLDALMLRQQFAEKDLSALA